jgi:membrane protein DedA with SNARE-associated domain
VHSFSDFWPFFTAFGMLIAAGIGAPIPEEIPTVAAGVWVGSHPELGPLRWLILPVCFLGVLISDVLLYGIGRRWGPRLRNTRWAQRLIPPETWTKIEANYHRYGIKVLLLVRWMPAIRSPMFISAGLMKLSLPRFIIADAIAAIFGHTLLFFFAWWFGDQFQSLIEGAEQKVQRVKPLIVLVLLAAAGGFGLYHFLRRPVSTADPQELPLIGDKVAHKIESSAEISLPSPEATRRPDQPPPSPEPSVDGNGPPEKAERQVGEPGL